jgi:hypothetical protein
MNILLLIVTVYFILYVGVNSAKQKIYFQPNTDCRNYPTDIPDVWVDGLHAWYLQSDKSNKTILYFHGNAGNIGTRLNTLYKWHDQGFSVLMYDYPGYGMSKGYPTEKSLYKSAEKMMEFLVTQTEKENIIPYGESIGCPVATYIASIHEIPLIVLQSGFSSMKEMASIFIPWWLDWVLPFVDDFNTHKMLGKYGGKAMLMHSKQDEIIPYSHAIKLTDFTTNLVEIHGTHNSPVFDISVVVAFMMKQ